jgi:peptidoglycan/xylan/chitin deacetylase (PgdA/CDA1 family)
MKITLTFDNGPDEKVTPQVLEILDKHNILSTFFVLGKKVAKPELHALSMQAKAKGHWIGNHTWTHEIPLGELGNVERSFTEISDTQAAIKDLHHERRFFRPFGGGGNLDSRLLSELSSEYLTKENFTVVLWNVVPGDWKDPGDWVETALQQITEQPWSVVVLHDMPTNGAMDRLEDFIIKAKALGAEFVQDFPDTLLPMRNGIASPELSKFIRN